MKWLIVFNDGSTKIAFGRDLTVIMEQLREWDYPIEQVYSIMMLSV